MKIHDKHYDSNNDTNNHPKRKVAFQTSPFPYEANTQKEEGEQEGQGPRICREDAHE
ncbi:MAG: hypothetical protein NVS4B12_17700 [Ktedonobacteraceae bacterium]